LKNKCSQIKYKSYTNVTNSNKFIYKKLDYENKANIYRDYVSKVYKECFLSFLSKQFVESGVFVRFGQLPV